MDAKQIKAALREHFTDCSVSVKAAEYTYLHQDSTVFEWRTLPALCVKVTGTKIIGETFRGKSIYNQPTSVSVVNFLRELGECAEYCCIGSYQAYVIDAQADQFPINITTGIGSWRKVKITAEA